VSTGGREDRGPGQWRDRERFLGDGVVPEAVRPEIARSWLRSRESGVRADGDPAARHADFDPAGRMLRLAQPVLDRLADEVSSADMTVILTDPSGLVLDRRAGSAALRRGLDRVLLVPGYSYAEDMVGTNGIGTAAEDRDVAWVVGSEHYAEWLRWLSCAGAPVRNPITGRVEGVIDLTCRFQDTSSLMVPFIRKAARDIERCLHEDAARHDRELLERFSAIARRSSRAVIALNAHTVIANAAAARLLEPSDHALLWNHGAEAIGGGPGVVRAFRLSEGSLATARCVDFEHGDPERGVVIEIELAHQETGRPRGRAVSTEPHPPALLPGRSLVWQQVWTAAAGQGATGLPLLVTGEPGTGKLTLARCVHEETGDRGPFTVCDASLARVDGERLWLSTVRGRLADSRGMLVLQHLESLDVATAHALSGMMPAAEALPRVVGTLSLPADGTATGETQLLDRFPTAVRVPPLRERPEDIIDIVPALIRRHAGGPGPRCSPDLVQVLMRADWPGNVRQLESLIHGMVARRPVGELTARDLPPEYQRVPWRRLSPMERVERAAILHALAQSSGGKAQAAALLGISRATLYRKLKELGIADTRGPFA
jgi:sigma-54 dependent transcriptional regulator, acetoin dehydrogenase operon transcriptional activator AcoR